MGCDVISHLVNKYAFKKFRHEIENTQSLVIEMEMLYGCRNGMVPVMVPIMGIITANMSLDLPMPNVDPSVRPHNGLYFPNGRDICL